MRWQPVPDINVAADKSVQTAVNITLLLIKSKVMTTSDNGLTIDDSEKTATVNINKTPNHGLRGSASPVLTTTGFVNERWQFRPPQNPHPLTDHNKIWYT